MGRALLLLLALLVLGIGVLAISAAEDVSADVVFDDERDAEKWHSGYVHLYAPAGYTISASATGNFNQDVYSFNGTHNGTFYYYLKDSGGNILQRSVELKMDNIKPETPATVEEAFTCTVTDTTITVTVLEENWHDEISGIKSFSVSIKQGENPSVSRPITSSTHTFTGFKPNLPYTVTVTAVDQAGNSASISTAADAVKTEKTDLSTTTVYIHGKTDYTATYTALPIVPADVVVKTAEGEIVPADQYTVTLEGNVAVGNAARLVVTAKEGGDYLNATAVTFSIAYLVTDDVAALGFGSTGTDGWRGGFATLTAPEGYTVSFSDAQLFSFINTVQYTADVDGEIVYYLKKTATGEIARVVLPLRLDVTKPTVEHVTVTPSNDSATVRVDATDALSGVASIVLNMNGTAYHPAPDGSFALTGLTSNTEYAFTVTVTDAAGNSLTTAEERFSTSRVDLSDPANTVTVTVGGSYTYNGLPHLPTADLITVTLNGTPLAAGDFEVLSADNNLNAGSATVTVGGCGDYCGTAVGSFVIDKASLSVTAKDQTIVYGDSILTTPDTFTVTGLAATDTLTCLPVREGNRVTVTDLAVTRDGADALGNYTVTTVSGALTVTPSSPTLTVDPTLSLDKSYDGTPVGMPAYTVNGAYTGTVTVEYYKNTVAPENLLSGAPVLPGSYVLVLKLSATAENNAATSAPMAVTVSRRAVTVTVQQQIIGFGGNISSGKDQIALPADALVAGHTVGQLVLVTDDVAVTEDGVINLKTLTVVDGAGRDVTACYDITAIPGRLVIKSGTLVGATVAVMGSYTYTGAPILPALSDVVVKVNGQRLPTEAYTVSATNNVNAGLVTLTVTGCGNYAGTATATYRIAKATATLTGTATARTDVIYNGKPQQLLATLPTASTAVEYSTLRLGIYSTDITSVYGTAAGTYTIYYRAAADENHACSEPRYVTVTVGKASVALWDLPTVSAAPFGTTIGTLTLTGGRAYSAQTPELSSIPGTWHFADPTLTATPGARYELVFVPDDSDSYLGASTLVSLAVTPSPVVVSPRPDHTQQFPGGTVNVTVSVVNQSNEAFRSDLPTRATLTWQIGENGTPVTVTGSSFQIPADLPKGTKIIIKAVTAAVPGKYQAGAGSCTVLVSDQLSVEIVGRDQTVIGVGGSFDVSTLFEIDPNAGEATYAIVGGTGTGTLSGTVLTVTASGSFIVEVTTASVGSYAAGSATATLTVTLDGSAPVVEGVTDGEQYYLTKTVTVTDESLVSLTLNGVAVTSPFTLPGNVNATYVIEATDAAGYVTVVTVEMETIESLAEPIATLTVESVKGSDKATVEGVVSALASLPIAEGTAGERDVISALLTKCDALLTRISGVGADMDMLKQRLAKHLLDTVTSADADELEHLASTVAKLLAGDNLDVAERAQAENYSAKLTRLTERLSDVAAELQRIRAAEAAWRLVPPTYEDIASITAMITDANTLLAGQNLTAEERTEVERLVESLSKMLSDISIFGSDIARITDALAGYHLETVTSADRAAIEQLQRDIESLLANALLNAGERAALEGAAEQAAALLQRITVVAAAISTGAVQGTAKITAENVKKANEVQLRTAKADLTTALEAFPTNYTEQELADIRASVERIDGALAALDRVAAVEAAIAALADPSTVVENDPAAIAAYAGVKPQYEALTDYERSILDAELRSKYVSFGRALTNYHVIAGDGSVWVENSDRGVTFEITCSSDRFVAVYVDGMQVSPSAFTVSSNGRNTVVELPCDYMRTLSTDAHTVLFLFEDGDATAGIIVEEEPASPWLWLLLIPILLVLLAAAYLLKRYLDRRQMTAVRYND